VITTQVQGAVGTIKVNGRFTFEDHIPFKICVNTILEGHWITEIGMDLSEATYMDSNALSMLLALRDKAQVKKISVKLVRPSASIRTILDMVQFDTLFTIVS